MHKVFEYLDYRKFLKDRFTELKKTRRGVSHRALMQKAGFASPNFLKLVMEGQRNLSEDSIPKIARAMDLTEKEESFFRALVHFGQAKDFAQKDEAYNELTQQRRDLSVKNVEHSQFEYFKDWYAVAIRELVLLPEFQEDVDWISARLMHQVTPAQVKKTLKLLETLKLLKRDAKGRLRQTEANVTAGDAVKHLAVYCFHHTMMEKAQAALQATPPAFRDISSITIAITPGMLPELKKRLQVFRREILALANAYPDPEIVYQLNLQLFNLSEIP